MEYEPCRVKLKNLLEDSSFQNLMTNVDENYNPENCKYYDTDEYNFMTRNGTKMKISCEHENVGPKWIEVTGIFEPVSPKVWRDST